MTGISRAEPIVVQKEPAATFPERWKAEVEARTASVREWCDSRGIAIASVTASGPHDAAAIEGGDAGVMHGLVRARFTSPTQLSE